MGIRVGGTYSPERNKYKFKMDGILRKWTEIRQKSGNVAAVSDNEKLCII